MNERWTITAVCGSTTVVFRLYGEISDARLQEQTFLCQRRANQLGSVAPKVRQWVPPPVNDDDDCPF